MNEKTIKSCRYFAGAIFVFALIRSLVSGADVNFWTVLGWAAPLLMAISMFTGILPLLAAGAGAQIISNLVTIIGMLPHVRSYNIWHLLGRLLLVIAYVLVLLSVFQRTSAVKRSKVSAILIVVYSIIITIPYFEHMDNFQALSFLMNTIQNNFFLTSLPLMLAGIVVQYTPENRPVKTPAANTAAAAPPSNRIERLTQLKELLDVGAITQEEFDAKKKELLNL